MLLLLQRLLRDIQQRERLRKADIRTHHVRFQRKLRGVDMGDVERAFGGVFVAAEEVETVREFEARRVVLGGRVTIVTQPVEIVLGPMLARDSHFPVDTRQQFRIHEPRVFVRVVDAGSLTAAAQHLNTAMAYASRAIGPGGASAHASVELHDAAHRADGSGASVICSTASRFWCTSIRPQPKRAMPTRARPASSRCNNR